MCILAVILPAFEVPFTAGTIIGGFSISYLFLIVSPTPSGIGIVEGIMPLALSSLSVPWSQAVIITLAYRGITFWLPLGRWRNRLSHIEAGKNRSRCPSTPCWISGNATRTPPPTLSPGGHSLPRPAQTHPFPADLPDPSPRP